MENLKKKTLIQQKLINLMSHDYEWYSKILGQLAIHDDFIKKMLKIQEKVQNTKTSCVIYILYCSNITYVLFGMIL